MSLVEHTPRFDNETAASLAEKFFGIRARPTSLPSERDQNFLLTNETGEKFVLKIANTLEDRALLESQNQAMEYLGGRLSFCPRIVPALSGEQMAKFESQDGIGNFVRLLTYLPGVPLAEVGQQSPELLRDLGKKLAQLDRELAEFDHPATRRDFHWDLVNGPSVIHQYGTLIGDPELRQLVDNSAENFERSVHPLLPKLRRSVIHGDANDYNVLISADDVDPRQRSVVGLIDFGDIVWSYTVGDLAVAIAYAVLDKPDPLASACDVVSGYTLEYPLKEEEIEGLYGLVLMRLCMSVCLAAFQQQQRPENDYLDISQRAVRASLPNLVAIDRAIATDAFRGACDASLSPGRLSQRP